MKTLFYLAAAIALWGPGAFAKDRVVTRSIVVPYGDLDLRQDAGRATLEQRVGGAVRRLCPMTEALTLMASDQHRACRAKAWAGARLQLAGIYAHHQYAGPIIVEMAAN